MKRNLPKALLFAGLFATALPCANAQNYVPLSIDVVNLPAIPGAITAGKLTIMVSDPIPSLPTKLQDHMFRYTHVDQDASAKLGIPTLGASATKKYENLFADQWRYYPVKAKVKIGNLERDAIALFGHGIRMTFKLESGSFGINGGIGSVSLGASYKQSADNFTIESHGFTTFHPVTLTSGDDKEVDAKALSQGMIDAFNLYARDGDTALGTPHLFGLFVSDDIAEELKKK